MKANFIALALTSVLAGLTSAQNGLPTCAQSCVGEYTSGSKIAGCSNIDIGCICSNSTFLSGISCCLTPACGDADKQIAVAYAQNLCKIAGVTNLPDAVTCPTVAPPSPTSTTYPGTNGTATRPAPTATGTSGTNSSTGRNSTATSSTKPTSTATSGSALSYQISLCGLLGGLGALYMLL
ncbi:hypothetical protein DSL72_004260 [Monilinia vaccinii-corymbosi]|uniref:CFEM domain-containing protein n=1 Tax=Monilinia vaccinii-corymbosi TaxID=61207 RepID=A0A8A3NW61_9HELO|nr:hypothetical protein DSL72_004260 [Monilinia vaccinii-corymbosi]